MKKLLFAVSSLALAAARLSATLPKDAIVFEAETLTPEGNAWEVKNHWDNWYGGHPSGHKMLNGDSPAAGGASATFTLPEAGTYYAWVRYLDVQQRQGEADAFTVMLSQGGKTIGGDTLNKATLRATDEGIKRWGWGWGQFVWQRVPFTAEKGEATLTLGKPGAARGNRNVDLFIVTADEQYEADVTDAHPLYVKARILPGQDRPCVIALGGRRSCGPTWYFLNTHIWRDGITNGVNIFQPQFTPLAPGESSAWVPLHKYLTFHRRDMITFSAVAGRDDAVADAAFEILFSKTPSDDGIFRTETRSGPGSGLIVNVNLTTGEMLNDREGSAQSLAWANATAPVEGARPLHFPFLTFMDLKFELSEHDFVRRELDALKIIGVNGMVRNRIIHPDFPHAADASFIWHLAKNNCQNDPNTEWMDNMLRDHAQKNAGKPLLFIDLMDEPYFEANHIKTCDICAEKFRAYTARHGVGMDGRPDFDPDGPDPARYYWSRRFQCNSMVNHLRLGTETARKHFPGIRTTSNYSTEIVFEGDMVQRGSDWHEALRTGALTYGTTEDWNNYSATYQTVGYMLDVMRSACRPNTNDYSIMNILDGRSAWDITAKGFCAIGHGVKAMQLYNYGPYYAPTCDTASHRPEIYQAIKDLTYPTGAVDKHLMAPGARVAKGDAALLAGTTSDIWSNPAKTGNAHGRERIYLHLLLTHCGYRLDVLNEDDLATELKNYKLLFATDSHLRAACLKPLADWVKAGGTLHLSAGALTYDEYNRPLGADKLLGITRQPLNLVRKAGHAELDLCRSKPLDEKPLGALPIYVGYQEPCNTALASGKGKVLLSGYFPGLSHIASSTKAAPGASAAEATPDSNAMVAGTVYSARDFQPAYRDYISSLGLPVRPRLTTGNPLVEAALIETPEADVIVLSNWTGQPQTVTVTLNGAPAYGRVQAFSKGAALGEVQSRPGTLTAEIKNLHAGAYILLTK